MAGPDRTAGDDGTARRLLDLLTGRPATLGSGRLLCLDGPAGSGKTTLGDRVGRLAGAPVVHLDDLYDGWAGLPRVGEQLATLLEPLARDEPGSYRRHDWHTGTWAETVTVAPGPLLVVEGVGAGWAAYAHLVGLLVWVDAPADLRLERAVARDGEGLREHWAAWSRDEAAYVAAHRPHERADVVVDGTGDVAPTVLG